MNAHYWVVISSAVLCCSGCSDLAASPPPATVQPEASTVPAKPRDAQPAPDSVAAVKNAKLSVFARPKICPAPDQATEVKNAKNTVNVKFMARGNCYAGSKIKDQQALGGFGTSKNLPRPITSAKAKMANACYLLAQPEVVTKLGTDPGMRLVLANATDQAVGFKASDSRLSVVQEALDETGAWRPVEYLPSSWCGNSYHRVFLGAGEYWEFPAPRYAGSFKTKLRFRLKTGKHTIFSNEFAGSINPEQFTARQAYQPKSIMDPYAPVAPPAPKK